MKPTLILRLEGAALFLLTFYLYQGPWWLFGILFMAPDIGLLGFYISPWVGSHAYNLFHTEVLPALLVGLGLLLKMPILWQIAIIWFSHINFDRMLGFGLKNPESFKETHLKSISS